MLLTEKAQANIVIGKINIDLKFDFRVMENLYYALNDEVICKRLKINNINPLELLSEMEEYNEEHLILIMHTCSNGIYDLEEIENTLKEVDEAEKISVHLIFKSIMVQSLIFIEKKDEEEMDKNDKKNSASRKVDFEEWFNYYYTMAIDKLKMNINDFYNSTASQIKERVYRVNIDKKNTYILAYVEVIKARNGKNSEVKEVEEVSSMYEFINKI